MKIATSLLATLLLTGSLVNSVMAADTPNGVIEKDPLTAGSYCHLKFPAIQGRTLDSDNPSLQGSTTGDVIDFYGPCDENPVGKDQVTEQKLEAQRLFKQNGE